MNNSNNKKDRKKLRLSDSILFGISIKREALSHNPLMQTAALIGQFQKSQIMEWSNIKEEEPYWKELQSNTKQIEHETKVTSYYLNEPIRKTYLKKILSQKEYKKEIQKFEKNKDLNAASKARLSFFKKENNPLEKQDLNELMQSLTAARWVKDFDLGYPTPAEVYAVMSRVEFLQPLKELTLNFQGRETELDIIQDYVDWFPKKGLLNKARGLFRETFSWHEKKPLLIKGIGGIGKSTLVAKFILDHLNKKKNFPFIYIDFDNTEYSISEPLFLLLEAFMQLKTQFPKYAEVFEKLNQKLYDGPLNEQQLIRKSRSTESSRSRVYKELLSKLESFDLSLKMIDKPIFLVFDSFEELQYQGANKSEFYSFLDTIKEIAERIPLLRPVFVGRSEIEFKEIEFDVIELKSFDKESSESYLKKLDVSNSKLRNTIYNNFGGNPLTLQLAASIAKDNNLANLKRINTGRLGRFLSDLDSAVIQKELVVRNLDHIHNLDVQKIAMPGLLVRKVTVDVIKEILAEPCGLGKINKEKAEEIFELLKQETFLIQTSSKSIGIVFRSELRKAMEKMVLKRFPVSAPKIHNNAISFYKKKEEPECKAEYIYHRLKRGDEPHFFNEEDYNKVSQYLDRSLDEFSLEAQVYIAGFRGSKISEEKLKEVKIDEWEKYYTKLIKDSLKGDLHNLEVIKEELSIRKERSFNSSLTYWEARLYQRLDQINFSNKLISRGIKEIESNNIDQQKELLLRFEILTIENLEYQFKFSEAYEKLKLLTDSRLSNFDSFISLQKDVIDIRLKGRLNIQEKAEAKFKNRKVDYGKNDTYKNYESYFHEVIVGDDFPFNVMFEKEYLNAFEKFKDKYHSFDLLEKCTSNYLGNYISGFTEPGKYSILIKDIFNRINKNIINEIDSIQKQTITKKLGANLAKFYPTIEGSKRLLEFAGLNTDSIYFQTAAIHNWANILNELKRTGTLNKLMKAVEEEYPNQFLSNKNVLETYPQTIQRLSELFSNIDNSFKKLKIVNIDISKFKNLPSRDIWTEVIKDAENKDDLERLLQSAIDSSGDDKLTKVVQQETTFEILQDASKLFVEENTFDKYRLHEMISRAKLKPVFNELQNIDGVSESFKMQVILQRQRFEELQKQSRLGIITSESKNIERNRIVHGLLNLINEIDVDKVMNKSLQDISIPSSILSSNTGINVPNRDAFEKIIGYKENILPIEWLEDALTKSKIVCKILRSNGNSSTGFLIKGGYVMTTHYSICKSFPKTCKFPCKENCSERMKVIFNYENDKEPIIYDVDQNQPFIGSDKLGYVLLKLKEDSNYPFYQWGVATFETFRTPKKGDLVSIIQHPEGRHKKIASPDRVLSIWAEKNYLFYQADTKPGSGGAPVFNKDWNIIALHEAKKDDMVINAEGDKIPARRGILMSAIIKDLQDKGFNL